MAVAATSGFAHLVAPGLRKVFFDTLRSVPLEMRQLFNIINGIPGSQAGGPAGGKYFDDLQVSSLGTFGDKPEGQAIQYDIPVEGNTVRYNTYTFGLGFRITEEMQEDDLYGVMVKMTQELAYAARHKMEVQAHKILNSGFSTTNSSGFTAAGFDALALFSASHVRLQGGTRANKAGTDLDLSQTALEQAIDIFEGWTNHSGMPAPARATILVHPYQLKWIAKELIDSELKPGSANNDVNTIMSEGLTRHMSHYLTDTDSWFLLGPKADHDLNVWIRREPRIVSGDDFDTGDAKIKGTFRMACGHGEPNGTFGSAGA